MLLGDALPIAESIVAYLQQRCCLQVSVAGTLRRRKDTIGDIDLLVGSDEPERAMEEFTAHPSVASVLAKGPTRSTVRLTDGTQVDLRVVPQSSYGAALQYFTGSKEHNVEMRRIAQQRGYKLNEYGLFRRGWLAGSGRGRGRHLPHLGPGPDAARAAGESGGDRGRREAPAARSGPPEGHSGRFPCPYGHERRSRHHAGDRRGSQAAGLRVHRGQPTIHSRCTSPTG